MGLHCQPPSWSDSLSMQFSLLHERPEMLLLLPQLVALLAAFLLGSLLHVLLKHLLALLGGQQQVARVKHDLMELLLPGWECWHLKRLTKSKPFGLKSTTYQNNHVKILQKKSEMHLSGSQWSVSICSDNGLVPTDKPLSEQTSTKSS